ncbi:unnamed protein product [Effrenium voratum]|nr:unnamed protein product [Effrenium voratum]
MQHEFQDGRSAEVSAAAQFKRKLAMVTQIFLGAEIYRVHKDARIFFGCRAQLCARWMNAEERRVIRGNLQLWGRATGASGARESNRVIRPTGTAVSSLMLDHQQRLC